MKKKKKNSLWACPICDDPCMLIVNTKIHDAFQPEFCPMSSVDKPKWQQVQGVDVDKEVSPIAAWFNNGNEKPLKNS